MKTVVHTNRSRDKLLHIEAEGCIINITVGLTDSEGHAVTHVEILCDNYSGEPAWGIPDDGKILKSLGVRVRQETQQEYENRRTYESVYTDWRLRIPIAKALEISPDWFDLVRVVTDYKPESYTLGIAPTGDSREGKAILGAAGVGFCIAKFNIDTPLREIVKAIHETGEYRIVSSAFTLPVCNKCYGEGEYACPICENDYQYSKEHIDSHFALDRCEDGRVPCDQCNGSGKSPKIEQDQTPENH